MPDLTYQQRYGNNCELTEDTDGNKLLTINLGNLQNTGMGIGEITDSLGLADQTAIALDPTAIAGASKILYLLLLLNYQQQPEEDTDPEIGVYISDGGLRFATGDRDGQIEYRYTVSVYANSTVLKEIPPVNEIGG